jgi:hypothetical protein
MSETDKYSFDFTWLISIVKELGLSGLLVLLWSAGFWFMADDAQKKEFVAKWYLFKEAEQAPQYHVFVIIALVAILFLHVLYAHKRIRALEKDLARVGQEKSELQSTLLNRALESSK